jgi:hypothetical protein
VGSKFRAIDAGDFGRTELPFTDKAVEVLTRAAEVSSLVRKAPNPTKYDVACLCRFLSLRQVMIGEMCWWVCEHELVCRAFCRSEKPV